MEARGGRELGCPRGSVTPADALKGALPVCLRSQACRLQGSADLRPVASPRRVSALSMRNGLWAVGWLSRLLTGHGLFVRWLSRLLTGRGLLGGCRVS